MRRTIVRPPAGRRRRARTRALVVAVAAAGAVVTAADPAAAETRLEVDAGHAGGHFVPGRPMPVRVAVTADRLVRGTVRIDVGTSGGGSGPSPVVLPVEVPGGSTKDVIVAVPVPAGAVDVLDVGVTLTGDGDDGTAAGSDEVTASHDTELVGLLPGVAEAVPGSMSLAVDAGTANFEQVDEDELAVPSALGGLGTVVAGPDGLGPLAPAARSHVLEWIDAGGRLVVDVAPGTVVDGLPDEWQPGDARRVAAGQGEVALSDGAAAAGRWEDVVEPTSLVGPAELRGGAVFASESVGNSVARDAGLRVPEVGWLVAFLVGYLLLVGPVAYVVLRRLRRPGWAWAIVPALAVVFSAGAVVAGDELRSGSSTAHASFIETGPGGSRGLVHVGLVSRTGRDGEARFPEGWLASGLRHGAAFEGGDVTDTVAAEVATVGGLPSARVPLEAGGFGVVTGSGPAEGADGLRVSATAAPDGSVTGTVVNGSDLALSDVLVLVGRRTVGVGDLAPGATSDWEIEALDTGPPDPWGPPEEPWIAATGWEGSIDAESPINYALWADTLSQTVDAYRPGEAVVAGWTRDWQPPVEVGGGLSRGRTAVVARAPVAAEGGSVPADAVRRTVVRGPLATVVAGDEAEANDWGPVEGAVVRLVLPSGADPAAPLVLDAPASVRQAEAWDGQAWVPVPLANAGDGAAADAGVGARVAPSNLTDSAVMVFPAAPAGAGQAPPPAAPPLPADPFDPTVRISGDLPAAAVRDGVVYLRIAALPDGPASFDVSLRGAS